MDLKLPHLGEGADSGTVVNIFVKEGDTISKDQAILELENEKAVATIPSTGNGTVSKIYIKAGDKISVGQRILTYDESGKTAPAPASKPAAAPAQKREAPVAEPVSDELESQQDEQPASSPSGLPPAAAPSLRKLAEELGIDLTRVRGSERGGRIVLADVRAYIQRLQKLAAQPRTTTPAPGTSAGPKAAEEIDYGKWGKVTRQPLSPLRQTIARRMLENWNAIPHVTQFDRADVTTLMELRKQYAADYEKKGTRLTLTSFALQIVADTLKKHPTFNSSLDEARQELVRKDYVHIGVAVDTEAGLIVPVIRDVDKKDLVQLSKELEEVARKARERKVTAEELKGGSFTISNQGGIGGGHFTPIINRPEVAILGMGRGAVEPVVRDKAVQQRLMLPLALSYDHRVIDGGAAARFIVDLVEAFEKFSEERLGIRA